MENQKYWQFALECQEQGMYQVLKKANLLNVYMIGKWQKNIVALERSFEVLSLFQTCLVLWLFCHKGIMHAVRHLGYSRGYTGTLCYVQYNGGHATFFIFEFKNL